MRWLFITLLAVLVGCVLSIIWIDDSGRWPQGDSRVNNQPNQPDPLTPPGNP